MRFEREGLLNFTEMNTFGSLYHEIQLGRHRPEQNPLAWDLHLAEVITLIAVSLEVMGDYYNRIGYWGLIEFRVSLDNILGMRIFRLPVSTVRYVTDESINDTDNRLHWQLVLSPRDMLDNDNRQSILVGLAVQIVRSFGYTDDENRIIQFLKEGTLWR